MKSVSSWVSPITESTKFRNIAASTIIMTIAVVRIVPSRHCISISQFSRRFTAASRSAATTPSEAASVGVARPA